MSEINQSLGFDASQAIDSLGKLQQSLSGVNAQIERMNKSTKGANLGGINTTSRKATESLNRLDKSTKSATKSTAQLGNEGAKNVGKLGNAFTSLGRIFAANVIINNIRRLIGTLDEASDAAREFEITIQRTLTIAGNDTSIRGLSAQVRELALELGKPIEEVSAAAFQTLQNDVGNTAESFRFLGEAAKLSTALNEDLELAMNALTSVQKSYGQSASEAAANADTLFVAIDKGRITLQQLGKRLGTINPLAATLGLEFEQTAAAAAALTQTGLRTSTATTQLRNVFSKLIKPTQSLQEGFERLGVQTGPQLIEKFGGDLPTALKALRGAFNDSDIAVANAFGTIRGQLGVLNLLADEGSLVTGILDDFADKAGRAQEAFDTVEATKARDYEKEIAKISDTMLSLGERFVDVELVALDFFNTLIGDADNAAAALAGVGSAATFMFAAFSTGSSAAAGAMTAFFKRAALPAAIFAALGATISTQISDITKTFSDSADEIERARVRLAKQRDKEHEVALEEAKQRIERKTRDLSEGLKQLSLTGAELFGDLQEQYAETTRRVEITSERLGENFAEGRKQLLSEIENFIKSIDDRIADGLGRIKDAQQDLADLRFDEQIRGLDQGDKAMAQMERSSRTAAEALQAFNNAGVDEDKIQAARELQRLAEQQAREALNTVGDERERARVAQNLENIIKQRIRTESQGIQEIRKIDKVAAGEQQDRVDQLLRQAANAQQEIDALNQQTTPTGEERTPGQVAQDNKRILELRQKINEAFAEIQNIPIVEKLNLGELAEKTRFAFEQGAISARFDFTNAIQTLQDQIASTPFSANVEFALQRSTAGNQELQQLLRDSRVAGGTPDQTAQNFKEGLQALLDESEEAKLVQIRGQQKFEEGLAAVVTALGEGPRAEGAVDRFRVGLANTADANAQIARENIPLVGGAVGAVIDFQGDLLERTGLSKEELGASAPIVKQIADNLLELKNTVDPTADDIQNVTDKIEDLSDKGRKLKQEGIIDQEQFEFIKTVADQATLGIAGLAEKIEAIPDILPDDRSQSINQALDLMEGSIQGINQGTQNAAAGFGRLEGAALRAARAVAAANAAGGGGGGLTGLSGLGENISFQNHGGMTRGMDNIPVMAREDEFFVNQRSSRRFFSELSAINAGQRPVFRDEGGSVTNVGDISVNVHTQGEGIDGHRLTKSIQREIRRNPNSFRR